MVDKTNTETSVELASTEQEEFFVKRKQRLLQVKGWYHLAGSITANFQLTEKDRKE